MKVLCSLVLLCLLSTASAYEPWPESVVEEFAQTPVLHNGRVKPFQTVATDTLFELSGKTKLTFEKAGETIRLNSVEWLLDVLFRPEHGRSHRSFIVDDKDVVVAIGALPKQKKRDLYSYDELFGEGEPRRKLGEMSNNLQQKQQADEDLKLGYLEEQILLLGRRVSVYEQVAGTTVPVQPNSNLALETSLTEFLQDIPKLTIAQVEGMLQAGPEAMDAFGSQGRMFYETLQRLYIMYRSSDGLLYFPPDDPENEVWESVSSLIDKALSNEGEPREWAIERIALLEDLASQPEDFQAFGASMTAFSTHITEAADARGETHGMDAEMAYNKDPFLIGPRILFIAAFVLITLSWLFASSKIGTYISWGAFGLGAIGFFSLCVAIYYRCVIRGWAPVTNLYETFLFIAVGGFLFGVIFEVFTRKRLALAVGIILPMLCLLFANLFRVANPGDDTLPPLVAVLRSNFWLTTHVLTITLGYCAGLVAWLISHLWILGQTFKVGTEKHKGYYKFMSGMTYGIILFSLLFSLVGTVLGGIWANYSWGRFWGWDPKENGALMIVLWTLVILHARFGGMIRDIGLHACSIILGSIILFSWFGVNAMGVGLHSYGFLGGVWRTLTIIWLIQLGMLGLITYVKFRDPKAAEPFRAAFRQVRQAIGSAKASSESKKA